MARPRDDWGAEYRKALKDRGFGRGATRINQPAVKDAFLTRFGSILDILPDAATNGWMEAIFRKHRQSFAPLHHILIRLLVDSLPMVEEIVNPFGPGPWSCRNPLVRHHGQLVITDCKLHKVKGKTIGVFRCSCGYAFSIASEPDSRAIVLDLGPMFEIRLRELIAVGGGSQRSTARALHVDRKTVCRHVTRLGLNTSWKIPTVRPKESSIERETMRAAWNDGHIAAPDLARTQLRTKIPAVYTWLSRHDRDWLSAQPPAAFTAQISTKPRYDWLAVDTATAETLRCEAYRLRAQSPPVRITRAALERSLGQIAWLERRLAKLPLCAVALDELTESVNAFQLRRIVWAAEELRQQDLPMKVWRLRKLAGLHNLCAPAIEMALQRAVVQDCTTIST